MPVPDPVPETAASRAALRQRCIAARLALAPADHARRSREIETHLEELLRSRVPAVIAFCWPIRAEFDCRPLVQRLTGRGWRACIPVVTAPDAAMAFRAWEEGTAMEPDRHGIPVPAAGPMLLPDVVLLPLVAFDGGGFRLGYGGGYFDRTLAMLSPRPWCIGIGFEVARIDTIGPAAHDIPMDVVVTEAGAWRKPGASV